MSPDGISSSGKSKAPRASRGGASVRLGQFENRHPLHMDDPGTPIPGPLGAVITEVPTAVPAFEAADQIPERQNLSAFDFCGWSVHIITG